MSSSSVAVAASEILMDIFSMSIFNQTLAGGLFPQCCLHHLEYVLVGAAHELLVCSNSDLGILLGGAVQLQQHRPLREGNCCQSLMSDSQSPFHLNLIMNQLRYVIYMGMVMLSYMCDFHLWGMWTVHDNYFTPN